MNFSERLAILPIVKHVASLHVADEHGEVLATLKNKPGQSGSLRVYYALSLLYSGVITPPAAQMGLNWYAEHVEDAKMFPGKHPNIDRLVECIENNSILHISVILRED
jgi:hypothetical protein